MSDERDELYEVVSSAHLARGTLQTAERLDDNLCARCKHGVVMRRPVGELRSVCALIGQVVANDLVQCSKWSKRGHEPSLYDMSQIALLVDERPQQGQYL